MSKNDAIAFFKKLDTEAAFRQQIEHARNERETLDIIHRAHLQFDAEEFRGVFEEKYHQPLKRETLHKLATEGVISPELAARLPFAQNQPHHGD